MTDPAAYAEHPPSAALRPYVDCYWTRGGVPPNASAHRVLPDGCLDVLFTFDAAGAAPREAFAVGTMTRALLVPPEPGLAYLGVRFRPGRARPFLGLPAAELTDARSALGDLWEDADALAGALAAAPTLAARIAAVERRLLARLARAPAVPRDVGAAVREIERTAGAVAVDALARSLGVTRQHLARRFAEHVGVPPKVLCRVVRGRAALARAAAGTTASWAVVAAELGYFDQSHLIAEVKALTGVTPEQWLARR